VEKRRPHFSLDSFKAVCGDPLRLEMTRSAAESSAAAGFEYIDVAAVVRSMELRQFFKSMTSYVDHRRWQDVYHVPWGNMVLYVKFTDDVLTDFIVLSFKER
jgi:motility quorum-sensing regulator/GCU-specific mRNA interferase toxin